MCFKGKLRQGGTCGLSEGTVPRQVATMPQLRKREENPRIDLLAVAKPKVLKKIKSFDIEGETR
jgi:hypothetical protein